MTDPGCVGQRRRPPPHFIVAAAAVPRGRRLDVEAALGRLPGDARRRARRRRLEGAGELDDRRQARLAAGPLEQRDLGPVQVAAVAQLFLGDADLGAGAAEVGGEALLGAHVGDSLGLTTGTLQTESFAAIARSRRFRYLAVCGISAPIHEIFTQKALSAGSYVLYPCEQWNSAGRTGLGGRLAAAKEES